MKVKLLEKINWILFQTKLAHWQEKKGYRHMILDNLYDDLNNEFDRFIETYQGAFNTQALIENELFVFYNHIDYEVFLKEMFKFIDELRNEFKEVHYLVNIIDDIDSIVNKFADLIRKD